MGQIHDNWFQYYENMYGVLWGNIPSFPSETCRARSLSTAYLTVILRSDNGYSGG